VEYRYTAEWTRRLESETHWRLYWRQQKLMEGLLKPDDCVLEIGVGSSFTTDYLRSQGLAVGTLDIDPDKNPDILANAAHYPFPDSYDVILAFEIFEHIPYKEFCAVLPRLAVAARRVVFLSLPRNKRLVAGIHVKLPKVRARSLELKVNRRRLDEPFHFWELDHNGVGVESLEHQFVRAGFEMQRRDEAFDRLFYALSVSERGKDGRPSPNSARLG
jgi:methyltransferase family protein